MRIRELTGKERQEIRRLVKTMCANYGKNNKLPSIASLKQEYATLFAEKKKIYVGYHELKENRAALLTAKQNSDKILGINKNAQNHNNRNAPRRNSSYEI